MIIRFKIKLKYIQLILLTASFANAADSIINLRAGKDKDYINLILFNTFQHL